MYRAWDFDPQVGLLMAGSGSPRSRTVERSHNGGKNFTQLQNVPYGKQGACLTIIDKDTAFYAGGMNCKHFDLIREIGKLVI